MPADMLLVLIVRGKPLKALVTAVEKAGGEVRDYEAPKPWKMAPWVVAHASKLGLKVDPEAARMLTDRVGAGEKRLARELEKLAIAVHPETRATAEDVERFAAGDAIPKVYDLADAVVAGDLRTAHRAGRGATHRGRAARAAGIPDHRAPARGAPGGRAAGLRRGGEGPG